jgi:hypothetical protein
VSLYETPKTVLSKDIPVTNKKGLVPAIICFSSLLMFLFIKFVVWGYLISTSEEFIVCATLSFVFQIIGLVSGVIGVVKYFRSNYTPVIVLSGVGLAVISFFFITGIYYGVMAAMESQSK